VNAAKVLIVEDSPTTRAVIKVYLVGHHLEFLEATNGDDGIQMARQHRPNVIVVDLKMPKMDGFTFCRTVRADARLKSTPIILLTGSKGEAIRREALNSGASFYMTKPIDSSALAERIVACLEQKP
jgi:two-component system, OmpR family, alkaline phosphatase synthesis response regulator PhoP